MLDENVKESIRYEVLLESIRKSEVDKRDALDEYVGILGKKNLKSHQEKLIESVTEHLMQSKQFPEGPHIKCAKMLAENKHLKATAETENYSPSETVNAFERIIASNNAHPEVRVLLLKALLDNQSLTNLTIDFIESNLLQDNQDIENDDFQVRGRKLVFEVACDTVDSKLNLENPMYQFRQLFLDRFATNKLNASEMSKILNVMIEKAPWNYMDIFERVLKVDSAPLETKLKSLEKVLENKKYSEVTVDYLEKEIFSEDSKINDEDFKKQAHKAIYNAVVDTLGSTFEPKSAKYRLRRIILDRYMTNTLPEGEMIKLTTELLKEGSDYYKELLAVFKLEGVHPEIREKARLELSRNGGL